MAVFNLDPTDPNDNPVYEDIRSLVGISADDVTIDANPLFKATKSVFVGFGDVVNSLNEDIINNAFAFCASANILRGGGSITVSSVQGRGEKKSESTTIGPVTQRVDYDVGASSSSAASTDLEKRIEFMEEQCAQLLESVGINLNIVDTDRAEICAFLV